LEEKPKDVIELIAFYEHEKLDDSAQEEKDRKKTQQKRRIAKRLGKAKDTDLSDTELKESLVKIKTGELVFTAQDLAKFYDANLKEITSDTPEKKEPQP
jgi:hypothetical protein